MEATKFKIERNSRRDVHDECVGRVGSGQRRSPQLLCETSSTAAPKTARPKPEGGSRRATAEGWRATCDGEPRRSVGIRWHNLRHQEWHFTAFGEASTTRTVEHSRSCGGQRDNSSRSANDHGSRDVQQRKRENKRKGWVILQFG